MSRTIVAYNKIRWRKFIRSNDRTRWVEKSPRWDRNIRKSQVALYLLLVQCPRNQVPGIPSVIRVGDSIACEVASGANKGRMKMSSTWRAD